MKFLNNENHDESIEFDDFRQWCNERISFWNLILCSWNSAVGFVVHFFKGDGNEQNDVNI